jgi:hypothetical protein
VRVVLPDISHVPDLLTSRGAQMTTQLFISWSGEFSHKVAAQLHEWIPTVLQSAEPFLSSTDIEKGSRWSDHVAQKLEECGFGIIILTPSNLGAPWILFEAGALSKMVGRGQVSALLIGLDLVDVKLPLSQFQNTIFQKDDVLKLILSINRAGSAPLKDDVLTRAFNALWPEFEKNVQRIVTEAGKDSANGKTQEVPEGDSVSSLKESIGELIQSVQSLREDTRDGNVSKILREIRHEIRRNTGTSIPLALLNDLRTVVRTLRTNEDMLGEDAKIDNESMTDMIERLDRASGWIENRIRPNDRYRSSARTNALLAEEEPEDADAS